jgi:hypothetical protein
MEYLSFVKIIIPSNEYIYSQTGNRPYREFPYSLPRCPLELQLSEKSVSGLKQH